MFETFELYTLQQYWWIIISLLASLLVFLMFVQGGQTLIYQLGKTETERSLIINTLGRKWELTFTTLVTFGGAFFASFPLFYSTSFGGAYWVWMAILFAFVIQAISYEYRTKPANFLGRKTYEVFLFLNGLLGTILIGTAVGTFFNGANFSVDKMNLTNIYDSAISRWETPFHGLEAVLNIHNVALGLSVFFLARVLGILYIVNSVNEENILVRARRQMWNNAVPFLVFFLYFVIYLLLKQGFAVNPETGEIFMEKYKYLHNLLQMPVVLILFLAGVAGVLYGISSFLFCRSRKAIWFGGAGTVLAVFSLLLIAGLNNTAYYPSLHNLQHSLTIRNSSSSHYTLTAMSYVSLFVPVVIAYIYVAWKSINNKPIEKSDLDDDSSHIY
ncbi:MAG TPA: cytochrome d ubiquinol oxidase subunit II [Lentimicrobium sp.]|jgi:cytochrome d ubiquinol oxidase subunit II|nr:cytochrome d ubiquinol oxidase subunit II [Lentimicrobium sp.]